jgi:uncharacterized iron-regulated protein
LQALTDLTPFLVWVVASGSLPLSMPADLSAQPTRLCATQPGVKAWARKRKTYRVQFKKGGTESGRKMLVGLGSLLRGELSGERMELALNSQDQEDELSCCHHNTHRGIVTNAVGI